MTSNDNSRDTSTSGTEQTEEDDLGTLYGGDPWWLIVFHADDGAVVTTAVDAANEEEATAQGERALVQEEGGNLGSHHNTRGPFPKQVLTEEREIRPKMCAGCGLKRYCGNHAPTPPQTWWRFIEGQSDENVRAWECIQCRTLTRMPREADRDD